MEGQDAVEHADQKLRAWLIRLGAALAGALIVGALTIGYVVFWRLPHDEHSTCVIQARGLPASKHLANVMRDIDVFLEPPDPKNPLARTLPKAPPVPAYYKPALENLRKELPAYNALEAKQPPGRTC
jgi:hypothetical protein